MMMTMWRWWQYDNLMNMSMAIDKQPNDTHCHPKESIYKPIVSSSWPGICTSSLAIPTYLRPWLFLFPTVSILQLPGELCLPIILKKTWKCLGGCFSHQEKTFIYVNQNSSTQIVRVHLHLFGLYASFLISTRITFRHKHAVNHITDGQVS